MRALLACVAASIAAVALPAAPAQAEDRAGLTVATPSFHGDFRRDGRDGDFRRDRDDRRDRRRDGFDSSVVVYDRDWEGDSAWRSNSFNDWWHDNPRRSSPRWVSHNRGCTQMWWGGGTWRC